MLVGFIKKRDNERGPHPNLTTIFPTWMSMSQQASKRLTPISPIYRYIGYIGYNSSILVRKGSFIFFPRYRSLKWLVISMQSLAFQTHRERSKLGKTNKWTEPGFFPSNFQTPCVFLVVSVAWLQIFTWKNGWISHIFHPLQIWLFRGLHRVKKCCGSGWCVLMISCGSLLGM